MVARLAFLVADTRDRPGRLRFHRLFARPDSAEDILLPGADRRVANARSDQFERVAKVGQCRFRRHSSEKHPDRARIHWPTTAQTLPQDRSRYSYISASPSSLAARWTPRVN